MLGGNLLFGRGAGAYAGHRNGYGFNICTVIGFPAQDLIQKTQTPTDVCQHLLGQILHCSGFFQRHHSFHK